MRKNNFSSDDHLYMQVAQGLEKMITDDVLKIGDKLPSVRLLSDEYGIRAQDIHWISTRPAKLSLSLPAGIRVDIVRGQGSLAARMLQGCVTRCRHSCRFHALEFNDHDAVVERTFDGLGPATAYQQPAANLFRNFQCSVLCMPHNGPDR